MGVVLDFPAGPAEYLTCEQCGSAWFNALVSLTPDLRLNGLATSSVRCCECGATPTV